MTPIHIRILAVRGVSLIFSLLALVALSLAGVALVRSIGTGTLVLGNIGFKQAATLTADTVAQEAIQALRTAVADKRADLATAGYYASVDNSKLDITGQQLPNDTSRQLIIWEADCKHVSSNRVGCVHAPKAATSTLPSNWSAQYVIFRMCKAAGEVNPETCAMPTTSTSGTSTKRGKLDYADYARFGSAASPYYRVIVRIQGDRNTVSYTETLVHF